MKKTLIAFLFVLLTTFPLLAKDFNITACTADQKKVVLTIDLVDGTAPAIAADIKGAFQAVASRLDVETLLSGEGFRAFIQNLTEEDYNAIQGIAGPPVVDGSCKAI